MLTYTITGAFYNGMTWEDFVSNSGPSVTIAVEPELITGDTEFRVWVWPNDHSAGGYRDASVKVLDRETAKKVLAEINNCRPEEIEIIELGVCAAT